MVAHTYGKKDRLQHTLLRMRAGDLFNLSREGRVSVLSEFCQGGELEEAVTDSYVRQENFENLPWGHLQVLKNSLVVLGHEIGKKVVADGDLSSVHAAIKNSILERIGERPKPAWHAVWHLVNLGLFLVWGAIRAAREETYAELAWLIWMLSVVVMWAVRLFGPAKWIADEQRRRHRETYKLFEDALSSGAEIELKAELVHREIEDLVTNQSWPGRGMPGGVPYKDPTLSPREKYTANPVLRPYVGKQRASSGSQKGYQASTPKRAEEICAKWLQSKRELSAEVTRDGADGGVDIRSNKYVAQVKNYKGSVPVQAIREIYGIASAEGKIALFFTSGNYTKAAMEFADSVKMPLIIYDATGRRFSGANLQGRMLA